MGNKVYGIHRKVKVNLEIEVDVDTLYEWRRNPISEEQLKSYIENDMANQIAEHLADDLCQDHILLNSFYDSVNFSVEYKDIKYEGKLI